MIESKNYISAYGANKIFYWFPMKITKSKITLLWEVHEKENIEYFVPTNDEVKLSLNGHKVQIE